MSPSSFHWAAGVQGKVGTCFPTDPHTCTAGSLTGAAAAQGNPQSLLVPGPSSAPGAQPPGQDKDHLGCAVQLAATPTALATAHSSHLAAKCSGALVFSVTQTALTTSDYAP